MGYLGNAPADQAVQIGTGSVEEQDIIDNVIVRTMATSVNTISSDLTLTSATNNLSFGDVTISGANTDVTVPSGVTWIIL
jgi:hypothetical protein|tara:strand:- start:53 stop:292 length:240 start_codon:yes stop_codon:yes gene_type:complete